MKNKSLQLLLVIFLITCFSGFLLGGCAGPGQDQVEKAGQSAPNGRIQVGFLYQGSLNEKGWVEAHEQGRHYLESQNPLVQTMVMDQIVSGEPARTALEKMIASGCTIIFSTSYEHEEDVHEVAARHPEVTFLQCCGTRTAANVGTYFGNIEQCDYLAGMLAAMMTSSDKVGYVASVRNPEVYRDINAFTLGARAAKEGVSVQVAWSGAWYDPAADTDVANRLIAGGCDVLGQDVAGDATQIAAEKAGIYSIGFNTDMRASAPSANLSSVCWNWGSYYVKTVDAITSGAWKSQAYIGGLDSDMIKMAPMAERVPEDVQQELELAAQKLITGELQVFAGPVRDGAGQIRVPAGQTASVEILQNMDWLVEGASPGQ